MQIVEKFSNGNRKALIGKVLNKKGQVRFVALNENKQLLINSSFVKKYAAVNITRQYLHPEKNLKIA